MQSAFVEKKISDGSNSKNRVLSPSSGENLHITVQNTESLNRKVRSKHSFNILGRGLGTVSGLYTIELMK